MEEDNDNSEPDIEKRIRDFEYTSKHPAFTGTLEFDVEFRLFDQTVQRRARAVYEFTPEWPYYDLHLQKIAQLSGNTGVRFEILLRPDEDYEPDTEVHYTEEDVTESDWEAFSFAGQGILPWNVWRALDDAIEAKCRDEDNKRRLDRGLPVDPVSD